MKLLLTSDFPLSRNEIILEHIRSKGSNPRIAWIPPFSKEGHERFPKAKEAFKSFGFINLDFIDIDEDVDERQLDYLNKYDVIYLTGGNPISFKRNIFQSGLKSHLLNLTVEDILIMGASGGSMQFTQNVSLFRLVTETVEQVIRDHPDYEALNIVDYEFLPHLNNMEPSFIQKVTEYSKYIDHDIISIADGSAIFHNNNEITYIGNAIRFHVGDMIKINDMT
ncbi:MAG: Type 1 glutamine amidotransferase-like domain-containing protein [Deltaproteobacteria bacterium]|nr:Type 1 glutamine amidotransferase-like domain-containing protein [Deltaproteobacteria bacterium]